MSNDPDEGLYEMSNYLTDDTGLPMVIWCGVISRSNQNPNIKVQKTYKQKMDTFDMFSVSISDNPKIISGSQGNIKNPDLKKVFKWIILNKTPLLKLWNLEYEDFDEFEHDIKKI